MLLSNSYSNLSGDAETLLFLIYKSATHYCICNTLRPIVFQLILLNIILRNSKIEKELYRPGENTRGVTCSVFWSEYKWSNLGNKEPQKQTTHLSIGLGGGGGSSGS